MSTNKILDGIIGLCVGDALGVPVEFRFREYLKDSPVKTMLAYGTHHQPKGTWSDDSSMTLCLLDSLQNGYDLKDIADKFVKWCTEALWTARGEVFDIGIATSDAINNLIDGCSPKESGLYGEWDNGNGSLMRILPMAFYLKNTDLKEKIEKITEVSAITHGHNISVYSCIFYVEYAINLLKGIDKFKAYENTIATIKPYIERYNGLSEAFRRVLSGEINQRDEDEIKSDGFVLHTLEASLWCLLNSETYKETVLKAVNLGDDTDTTAAVAGGLAGIYYGLENIPTTWVNNLANKNDITKLCTRLNDILQ